jgi:hypothetical protein
MGKNLEKDGQQKNRWKKTWKNLIKVKMIKN